MGRWVGEGRGEEGRAGGGGRSWGEGEREVGGWGGCRGGGRVVVVVGTGAAWSEWRGWAGGAG